MSNCDHDFIPEKVWRHRCTKCTLQSYETTPIEDTTTENTLERPDMKTIERMFKIMSRPSAYQSRQMADYIYELERMYCEASE